MNLLISISFLLVQLFIDYFSIEVIACNSMSRIDSITYLNYDKIAFVLTSNGYYYIIHKNHIRNDTNEFEVSGKIPHFFINCCDSAVIKDIDDCEEDHHNEHTINFLKYTTQESKYISLNLIKLVGEEQAVLWSQPKSLTKDSILSKANIDYSRKINAIFNTDNSGEIFFIQDEYYSGIEITERCPNANNIIAHNKQPLSDLNVFGKIDSAYYEQNHENYKHYLYLLNYDNMQFYKVEIDRKNSKNGKLLSVNTTLHPISSHPILSKICAPNNMTRKSSQLQSAENPSNDISSNVSTIVSYYSIISIIFNFILWYSIN